MQIVNISNHLGVTPVFERIGCDRHYIILRARR
jgi:hypothetical protein